MAFYVFNVTIGTAATPLITAVAGHRTPFMEIQFDPVVAHDTYVGDSTVSATKYALKLPASSTVPRVIANGPNSVKIDDLENIYLSGTQNDVIRGYALTL